MRRIHSLDRLSHVVMTISARWCVALGPLIVAGCTSDLPGQALEPSLGGSDVVRAEGGGGSSVNPAVGGGDSVGDGGGAPCDACAGTCCNDVCVDYATDPQHCGSCENDCGGGACSAGMCQPISLGEVESLIGGDENTLYVLADGKLGGFDKVTKTITTITGAGVTSYQGVGAQHIYRVESGAKVAVTRVSKMGGNTTTLVSFTGSPAGFSVLGDTAIWSNYSAGTIGMVVGLKPPTLLQLGGAEPTAIAQDEARIYYTDLLDQRVHSMDYNGGDVLTLADVPALQLLPDGQTLFASTAAAIFAVPTDGTHMLNMLANSIDSPPNPLSQDEKHLYYEAGGQIWQLAKDGSAPPKSLAIGQAPDGVVVDDDNLYFLAADQLVRLPKP